MACRVDETRKDKYCIAPFLSPAITPTGFKMCSAPCAKSFPTVDFWNGEYMKKIRKEWIDGIVPDDCEDCYLNADGLIGSDALPTNSVTIPLNFDNLYIAEKILNSLGLDFDRLSFVEDRPGHDFRYAVNYESLLNTGWLPKRKFDDEIEKIVEWYQLNGDWLSKGADQVNKNREKRLNLNQHTNKDL